MQVKNVCIIWIIMKHQQNVYLCRHGETNWSLSGQHTGLTDLALTENGKVQAQKLAHRIKGISFDHVFCSPLLRAKQTAEICHLKDRAILDPDLVEWDYGDYEGLTNPEIKKMVPDWNIFTHGAPHGESLQDIQKRATRFIQKISSLQGNICFFSSGHISRSIIASWIDLDISEGRHFILATASLSILGYERDSRVIKLLNDTSHYA